MTHTHTYMGKGRESCKFWSENITTTDKDAEGTVVNVPDILTEVTEKSLNKQVSTGSFFVSFQS